MLTVNGLKDTCDLHIFNIGFNKNASEIFHYCHLLETNMGKHTHRKLNKNVEGKPISMKLAPSHRCGRVL